MDLDYELEIELPIGNGDYGDTEMIDMNINFQCEEISAQPDVGIMRDYIEVTGFELPTEYKDDNSVIAQVDSCVAWVQDQFNEGL